MDGTIADLYGVNGWLGYLQSEDTTPYRAAKVLVNMQVLARRLNSLQRKGYEIGIVSWTSKNGSDQYNKAVAEAKREWLRRHLRSVKFDFIAIVPYGYSKSAFAIGDNDILFDDEERNRAAWTGVAYDVNEILNILKNLE
jgi:hypothetical protein